jgi:hypothetical protein
MNNPREPKKNEIVKIKSDPTKEWKVEDYCLGLVSLRENIKRSRNKIEVSLDEIEYTTKENTCLSLPEKKEILRRLVEENTLKTNFRREIILLSKMWLRFPHRDFWLEGFKPALKVDSLTYWYNRGEVEHLYKAWSVDLSSKTEEVKLEKEKIGIDIVTEKKQYKNLLELLK